MRRMSGQLLALVLGFAVSLTLSAQSGEQGAQSAGGQSPGRGNRGAPAGQARGGRGGAPEPAGDFFDFEAGAQNSAPVPDGPPTESHQKITAGGQALAYTARAGYLALRSATSGQSQAHLFFTYYAKDGVSDASSRPLMFVVGGAPGFRRPGRNSEVSGQRRLRSRRMGPRGFRRTGGSTIPTRRSTRLTSSSSIPSGRPTAGPMRPVSGPSSGIRAAIRRRWRSSSGHS